MPQAHLVASLCAALAPVVLPGSSPALPGRASRLLCAYLAAPCAEATAVRALALLLCLGVWVLPERRRGRRARPACLRARAAGDAVRAQLRAAPLIPPSAWADLARVDAEFDAALAAAGLPPREPLMAFRRLTLAAAAREARPLAEGFLARLHGVVVREADAPLGGGGGDGGGGAAAAQLQDACMRFEGALVCALVAALPHALPWFLLLVPDYAGEEGGALENDIDADGVGGSGEEEEEEEEEEEGAPPPPSPPPQAPAEPLSAAAGPSAAAPVAAPLRRIEQLHAPHADLVVSPTLVPWAPPRDAAPWADEALPPGERAYQAAAHYLAHAWLREVGLALLPHGAAPSRAHVAIPLAELGSPSLLFCGELGAGEVARAAAVTGGGALPPDAALAPIYYAAGVPPPRRPHPLQKPAHWAVAWVPRELGVGSSGGVALLERTIGGVEYVAAQLFVEVRDLNGAAPALRVTWRCAPREVALGALPPPSAAPAAALAPVARERVDVGGGSEVALAAIMFSEGRRLLRHWGGDLLTTRLVASAAAVAASGGGAPVYTRSYLGAVVRAVLAYSREDCALLAGAGGEDGAGACSSEGEGAPMVALLAGFFLGRRAGGGGGGGDEARGNSDARRVVALLVAAGGAPLASRTRGGAVAPPPPPADVALLRARGGAPAAAVAAADAAAVRELLPRAREAVASLRAATSALGGAGLECERSGGFSGGGARALGALLGGAILQAVLRGLFFVTPYAFSVLSAVCPDWRVACLLGDAASGGAGAGRPAVDAAPAAGDGTGASAEPCPPLTPAQEAMLAAFPPPATVAALLAAESFSLARRLFATEATAPALLAEGDCGLLRWLLRPGGGVARARPSAELPPPPWCGAVFGGEEAVAALLREEQTAAAAARAREERMEARCRVAREARAVAAAAAAAGAAAFAAVGGGAGAPSAAAALAKPPASAAQGGNGGCSAGAGEGGRSGRQEAATGAAASDGDGDGNDDGADAGQWAVYRGKGSARRAVPAAAATPSKRTDEDCGGGGGGVGSAPAGGGKSARACGGGGAPFPVPAAAAAPPQKAGKQQQQQQQQPPPVSAHQAAWPLLAPHAALAAPPPLPPFLLPPPPFLLPHAAAPPPDPSDEEEAAKDAAAPHSPGATTQALQILQAQLRGSQLAAAAASEEARRASLRAASAEALAALLRDRVRELEGAGGDAPTEAAREDDAAAAAAAAAAAVLWSTDEVL
jgi:hypothetical protein